MEKKKTIAHFFGVIAMIAFAVTLFQIASGKISLVETQRPDGSFDKTGILKLVIAFSVAIMALAALITVLQDGEFMAWLGSVAVIAIIAAVGFFLGISVITGALVAGLYAIWWLIASLRHVSTLWHEDAWWASRLMALCRILIALAVCVFVVVWLMLPSATIPITDPSQVTIVKVYTVGGVAAIVAAVALFIEAVLWIKFCEY